MKFSACIDCANFNTEPWICRYCEDANNYEPDSNPDEVIETGTLDDLREIARAHRKKS